MARGGPELAARLGADGAARPAAARIPGKLEPTCSSSHELGTQRVSIVRRRPPRRSPRTAGNRGMRPHPISCSTTDPAAFAALAERVLRPAGADAARSPARARQAAARAAGCGTCRTARSPWRTSIAAGGTVDPDLLYRSLPYLVDPAWTRGPRVHRPLLGHRRGRRVVHRRCATASARGHAAAPRARAWSRRARRRCRSTPISRLVAARAHPVRGDAEAAHDDRGRALPAHRCWGAGSRAPRARRRGARARGGAARVQARGPALCSSNGIPPGAGRSRARVRRPGRRSAAARLPAALRALGDARTGGPRARLLRRSRALGGHAGARPRQNTIWSLGSFYVGRSA